MIDDARLPARFWSKVAPCPMTGCWLWIGSCNETFYGSFWLGGRLRKAHRVAYEALVGPIPAGLHLDHLCRTPPCVNPTHLEAVTPNENWTRGRLGMNPASQEHNRRKTHCSQGHSFTAQNTYRDELDRRRCRRCAADRASRRRAARREAQV